MKKRGEYKLYKINPGLKFPRTTRYYQAKKKSNKISKEILNQNVIRKGNFIHSQNTSLNINEISVNLNNENIADNQDNLNINIIETLEGDRFENELLEIIDKTIEIKLKSLIKDSENAQIVVKGGVFKKF